MKTPTELKTALKEPSDNVALKVIPNKQTPISPDAVSCFIVSSFKRHYNTRRLQKYVRAQFDWDPKSDEQLKCKDIGLQFKSGDVLHVINQDDKEWWQVMFWRIIHRD